MQKITLKSLPLQTFKVPLQNVRTNIEFTFRFMPTQMSWYFDFVYNEKEYKGHKLVLGANILRNYKNTIPFGLSVQAENDIEPFSLNDLNNGRVNLFVLDKDEVTQIEESIYNEYN